MYNTLAMQRAIRDEKFSGTPWVFFRYATGERLQNLREAWEAACYRAGLWNGDEKTGRPAKLFHDLCRTGLRNLVRTGAPETVAMKISGHKTRSVFGRYNIVSESDLKEAAKRLGEYMAKKSEAERNRHTIGTHAKKQASGRNASRDAKLLN
ncbi:MAG: hypothetical protein ABFD60_09175 [Bryobacteraceae bacterium]